MYQIFIETSIFPTEDRKLVSKAVLNLFPDADISLEDDRLHGAATNMDHFIRRMGEQHIRDSARTVLMRSVRNDGILFYLNKQAALVGKVNFTDDDSILGDIEVTIETRKPDDLIQQMTGVNEE